MKSLSANLYLTHASNSSLHRKEGLLGEDLIPCLSLLFVPLPALLLSVSEFINGRDPSEHDVFLQNSLGDKKNDWQLQKLHLRFGPAGKGAQIACELSVSPWWARGQSLRGFNRSPKHRFMYLSLLQCKHLRGVIPAKTPLLFFILLKYGDGKCVNANWYH